MAHTSNFHQSFNDVICRDSDGEFVYRSLSSGDWDAAVHTCVSNGEIIAWIDNEYENGNKYRY